MTDTTDQQQAIESGDAAEHFGESSLDLMPAARPADMAAIGTLRQHVEAMESAYRLAVGLCRTPIIPARFHGKPRDATAAILFGAEVGLSPIASLRSVIVIHGQPGFEARTMKAICKANGYRFRTIEKTATRAEIWAWEPDSPVVRGTDPDDKQHYGQRINPDEIAAWTIEDAVQAGFVPTPDPKASGGYALNSNGKLKGNMKYLETPKIMLDAKVTAEVCRSIAPHLLLGLPYAAEELDEIVDTLEDAEPVHREPARGRGVDSLRERANEAKQARAAAVDAEVVEDDAPAPNDIPPAQPEVQPETPPTVEPDTEPAPTEPDSEPAPMSPADRTKGLAMMHGLLINGGIDSADDESNWNAISEIVAKAAPAYRRICSDADLSDGDLLHVVNTLRVWKTRRKLNDYLGEAVNNGALREAGMLEGDG